MAGKNAKHGTIMDSSAIAAVLNIGVQLFKHMYGLDFCVIPEATSTFLTKQFALLHPISFLTLMTSNPQIPARCTSFELGTADHQIFETLWSGHSKFTKAMKLFAQRKQTVENDEEEWYGIKSIQLDCTLFSNIVHPLCVYRFVCSLAVLREQNLIFFGDFEGFLEARLVIRTPTGRKLS